MASIVLTDKAANQLQQLASMAYGHGTNKAGSGRIGLIAGQVVKFNTHHGERLARTTDAMRRSCDALRMHLGALARDIYGSNTMSAGMSKILRDLGLNESGQLVLQKKSLLDRKTVAKFVDQVKADSENARLPECGSETRRDSHFEVILNETYCDTFNNAALPLKDRLYKELRCKPTDGNDETQEFVDKLYSDWNQLKDKSKCDFQDFINTKCAQSEYDKSKVNPETVKAQIIVDNMVNSMKTDAVKNTLFNDFAKIVSELMTGQTSLSEAEACVAENCKNLKETLSLRLNLSSQAMLTIGFYKGCKDVPPGVPKSSEDLLAMIVNQAQSDMMRELERLAAESPDSTRLGFVRGFAQPFGNTELDKEFESALGKYNLNSHWVDRKQSLSAHDKLHKLEREILSKTDRLAQSVVGGTMTAKTACDAFEAECIKFGLGKKVAKIIREAAHECEQTWTDVNDRAKRFESDFFEAVAKRFDEMENWRTHHTLKDPPEMSSAAKKQSAEGQSAKMQSAQTKQSAEANPVKIQNSSKVDPAKVKAAKAWIATVEAKKSKLDMKFDGICSNVKVYFRSKCLNDGRCDMQKLRESSLRDNIPIPNGLADNLRAVANLDDGVTDVDRDFILGLLQYVPVEKWFSETDQIEIEKMYALLKGVAADLGLLMDDTSENYGNYDGPPQTISFVNTGSTIRKPAKNNTIPDGFQKQISSVLDNPGAGHCFFYSVLDSVGGKTNSEDQAKELRGKLIEHASKCTKSAHPKSPGIRNDVNQGGWTVLTSRGRVNISEAVRQVNGDADGAGSKFSESEEADLTNAAFLADMVKRPVVVLSTVLPTATHFLCFDCELANGQRLTGKPIYILHTPGHFRSFTPSAEFAAQFENKA